MRTRAVFAIAANTFREALRDKILYLLFVFGIILIAASRVISWLTVGAEIKIIIDVGLAAISVFGVLTAIFIGISLVQKEIERRTVHTIITKPVHRYEFILGKFAGLALTLFVMVAVMSIILQGTVYLKEQHLSWPVMRACVLVFVELLVIVSVAIVFSSFSTPILSFLLTLLIYVIGHVSYGLVDLAEKAPSGSARILLKTLYYLLPNLESFNLKAAAVHDLVVPQGFMLASIEYGLAYTATMLLLATVIFQRRDFA